MYIHIYNGNSTEDSSDNEVNFIQSITYTLSRLPLRGFEP